MKADHCNRRNRRNQLILGKTLTSKVGLILASLLFWGLGTSGIGPRGAAFGVAWAQASPRAILLVWNSEGSNEQAKNAHRDMIAQLKRLRGEGVLAKAADLDKKIKVYDYALPEHAKSLQALGLGDRGRAPYVCLIRLDAQGLPSKILSSSPYLDVEAGLSSLSNQLGLSLKASDVTASHNQKEERRIVMVLDSAASQSASSALSQYVTSHFSSVQPVDDLADQPYSYAFTKAADSQFLEAKGLKRNKGPYLTVIRFVGNAPRDVLWSASVTEPSVAWQGLLVHLGLSKSVLLNRKFVLVAGSQAFPTSNELIGKLRAILKSNPPEGFRGELEESSGLPALAGSGPCLAIVGLDAAGKESSVVWQAPIGSSADELLVAAYTSVGQSYQPPVEYTNPKDGSVLRLIVGGRYQLGVENPDGKLHELPIHTAGLRNFYMGKYEVTVDQFGRYLSSTNRRSWAEESQGSYVVGHREKVRGACYKNPDGSGRPVPGNFPAVHVSQSEADSYCRWAGLALPKEAQWEWAGRSPDQRLYPSGSEVKPGDCRSSLGHGFAAAGGPASVGTHPADCTPSGLYDMGGNVCEWTCQQFFERLGDAPNPLYFIVRGGSWPNEQPQELKLTKRLNVPASATQSNLGFRVALYDDRQGVR